MNANTASKSNVNPITSIIAGVMKDATTQGNRQAALVVAMFDSEVTFNPATILNIFSKEGLERTTMIDSAMAALSEDYADALSLYERLTDKDYRKTLKDDKDNKGAKERNRFETDAVFRKIRAARMMFTRALQAVYHLRESKAVSIKTNNIGTGALAVLMPTKEFPDHPSMQRVSVNELTNAGDNAIKDKLGKKSAPRTAKHPAANVLSDASKSLAAVVRTLHEPLHNGNGKVAAAGQETKFENLSNEERTNLESIFKELFVVHFFDGDKFDKPTFDEWLKKEMLTYVAKLHKPAQKQEEQKQEQKQEEQKEKAA